MERSLQHERRRWSKVRSHALRTDKFLNSDEESWSGSRFKTSENIEAFSQRFDEGLKRVFSDNKGTQYVKFGSVKENDPSYGIKAGRLALTG